MPPFPSAVIMTKSCSYKRTFGEIRKETRRPYALLLVQTAAAAAGGTAVFPQFGECRGVQRRTSASRTDRPFPGLEDSAVWTTPVGVTVLVCINF